MIVQLTHYQARVVMTRVPELYATAMSEHRYTHGPKAHGYDLPAIAWRQIRDHLYLNPAYYGPLGGKLDSQPHALYRAIQLIHTKVIEMEHHPAYENMAVMGEHMQILPAWTSGAYRSPYPTSMWTFRILGPRIYEYHGETFTEWLPAEFHSNISWTFDSINHAVFADAGVLPLPQL